MTGFDLTLIRRFIEPRSNGSHTAAKQPNPIPGNKPFVKGDPRINRGGRPKSFDQFRALAQQIGHEELQLQDGRKISVAEAMLRKCAKSNEAALIKTFFEYAFGKVPDKIEATGLENKTTLVLKFDHERPELAGRN